MENGETIASIVEIEWKMLQDVKSIVDGLGTLQPSCCPSMDQLQTVQWGVAQTDRKSFEIDRSSQFMTWPTAGLESYLRDLREAEANGRNLVTERYARMMKSTSPQEYSQIASSIPSLSSEAPPLIDSIVEIVLEWQVTLAKKYPGVARHGRPIRSEDDTASVPSVETYLRGELATYSAATLKLYLAHVSKLRDENVNGAEVTLGHIMEQYGFKSLEEANARLKALPSVKLATAKDRR